MTLFTGSEQSEIALDEGSYADFYSQVAAATGGSGEMPVSPQDAVELMRVVEAVRAAAG